VLKGRVESHSIGHPRAITVPHASQRSGVRSVERDYLDADFDEGRHCGILALHPCRMHQHFGHRLDTGREPIGEAALKEI